MNNIFFDKVYWQEIVRFRREKPKYFNIWPLFFQYQEWKNSLESDASPIRDHLPWITYGGIEFLKKKLNKRMVVYEYGSGGSTLFFAERAGQVFSCEHDPDWAFDVEKALTRQNYDNYDLTVLEPSAQDTSGTSDSWSSDLYSSPNLNYSSAEQYKYLSFEKYVKSIDRFPDNYFDVVLIDGRARPSCCKQALPKVKKGGHIILDNSERSWYEYGKKLLSRAGYQTDFYGPGPYNQYFWQTSVWEVHC